MIEADEITVDREKALLAEWFDTVAFDEESEGIPPLEPERDDESRHMPGKHNQQSHADGNSTPRQGVLSGGKVNIGGKQYGVGDSITIKGKEHYVASIDNSQVRIKPGKAPASLKGTAPTKVTANKTSVTTKTKSGKKVAEYPSKNGSTKDVPVTEGKRMSKAEYLRKAPPKLNRTETAALKTYVDGDGSNGGAAYKAWNNHLRFGDKVTVKEKAQIKTLTAAINRHSVPDDIVVTRRVGLAALGLTKPRGAAAPVGDVVGKSFVDKGFTSTTLMNDIDGVDFRKANVKMNINVPKGTKGLLVNVPRPNGVDEQEVLFPPGTKQVVRSATKGEGSEWTLEVDIVP